MVDVDSSITVKEIKLDMENKSINVKIDLSKAKSNDLNLTIKLDEATWESIIESEEEKNPKEFYMKDYILNKDTHKVYYILSKEFIRFKRKKINEIPIYKYTMVESKYKDKVITSISTDDINFNNYDLFA